MWCSGMCFYPNVILCVLFIIQLLLSTAEKALYKFDISTILKLHAYLLYQMNCIDIYYIPKI